MSKIISFSLAGFVLLQSFNIHVPEVGKLKNLLEHLEFHKSAYGDDIFSFVAKHYGKEKLNHENKEDHGDHQQLPFHHHVGHDFSLFYIIDLSRYQLRDLDENDTRLRNFSTQTLYSFLENIDIFQPPKYL